MSKEVSKKKVGRPKAEERTQSYTVSLKPSQKADIEQEHSSLTIAILKTIGKSKPEKVVKKATAPTKEKPQSLSAYLKSERNKKD